MLLRSYAYVFPASNNIPEALILSKGWAHFSCAAPFKNVVSTKNSKYAECELFNGKYFLVAKNISLAKLDSENWKEQGIVFEFGKDAMKRFIGKKIEVSIDAACENCSGPVKAVFATSSFGNSGWRDLDIVRSQSMTTFIYKVPDRNPDNHPNANAIVVLNPQSPQGTLLIHQITIKGAE